jgi:acetyl esterase/lipase
MDVAYRLASEADLMGMIHDVKRAIFWMKENAGRYSVDPELIVVGGGSSGGYLALMAAYTSNDPGFTQVDLSGKDFSCCAVIAEFPPTDLEALYYHTNQQITNLPEDSRSNQRFFTKLPTWLRKIIGRDLHRIGLDKEIESIGKIEPLMGGHPDQCPEQYIFFSPFTYVNSQCPPTLLIQGNHDIMSPVKSTRLLFDKLIKEEVPAILHILPQTDHAFNRFLPNIAPSAHNALYNEERFLAITVNKRSIQNK